MTTIDPQSLAWTRIEIPGTSNLRDLGGLTTFDGRSLGTGRLYRGEVITAEASPFHSTWDPELSPKYEALGLQTIIDLRSEHECVRVSSSWPVATKAGVVHVPIAEGAEGTDTHLVKALLSGRQTRFDEVDLAEFYIGMLERRAREFAAAVHELARPGALPALVHCAAGKDRTGMLIALVLEVLGVPRETVVADYALTGVLRPNRIELYAPKYQAVGIDPQNVRAIYETPAWALTMALEFMDRTYVDAENYLVNAGGLDPTDIPRLRTELLVAP